MKHLNTGTNARMIISDITANTSSETSDKHRQIKWPEVCKPKQHHQISICQFIASPSAISHAVRHVSRSVGVDAKQSDAVELRQLWDENGEQRHRVDDKVILVILGVEAGQEKPKSHATFIIANIIPDTILVTMQGFLYYASSQLSILYLQ